MPFDSDVALLGTGAAPLVAANHLLAQGKSVLLLNPDWDFFLEDSELPLDPLLWGLSPARLAGNLPERALDELRPDFPGAIEFSSGQGTLDGFHDAGAPHVRSRGRLWITSIDKNRYWDWERLEDLYVEASDAGLNPQILEGLQATKRFPGFSAGLGDHRGLLIPKLCDVDITRYRNGLLEFVKERLGPERVVCAAGQIELMPGGVRFYSQGSLRTARLRDGMLVFWTPRLSQWVFSQAKKAEVTPKRPKGVRLWEQWSLTSRESLDPSVVGMYRDMVVWAEIEGAPQAASQTAHRLAVLRSGSLVDWETLSSPAGGMNWASAESLAGISHLCQDFLKWDHYSVRSLRPRAIFEWEFEDSSWQLSKSDPEVRVLGSCDGPLVDVVRIVRQTCDQINKEETQEK